MLGERSLTASGLGSLLLDCLRRNGPDLIAFGARTYSGTHVTSDELRYAMKRALDLTTEALELLDQVDFGGQAAAHIDMGRQKLEAELKALVQPE